MYIITIYNINLLVIAIYNVLIFIINSSIIPNNQYPQRVVLGFMGTSWFLSMWLSNTATTTMMVPLVRAIVSQLKTQEPDSERVPYTKRFAGTMFVVDSQEEKIGRDICILF